MIPSLSYEITNYFYENYPDELRGLKKTTEYIGKSGSLIKKGHPLFIWRMDIEEPPKTGMLSRFKKRKEYSEVIVKSPANGYLVGVQDWETMYSNNMKTSDFPRIDVDDITIEHIQQTAVYIYTQKIEKIIATEPYQEFFDFMYRLGNGGSWLSGLIDEEVARLSKGTCPVVDSKAFAQIIKSGTTNISLV